MKLNQAQTNLVGEKLGLNVVDPESPAQPQFEEAFGDHSFFVNQQGVFIVTDEEEDTNDDEGRLFAVAAWSEEDENKLLVLSEPANVNVTIDLRTGDVQGGA